MPALDESRALLYPSAIRATHRTLNIYRDLIDVLPAFRNCLLHNMTQKPCGLALMDSNTEDSQSLQGKKICSRLVRIREPRPVRFVLRDKEIVGAWSRKPMISRDVVLISLCLRLCDQLTTSKKLQF
jgi:hypothetical protein